MSLSPFHAAVPWLAYARWPRRFSFWALTLGSMVPDLEVLAFFVLSGDIHTARGPMHSLVGALTVDAAVTALVVWLLAPPLLRWADRRWPGTTALRFAGQDLRKDPRAPATLFASGAFGALTHVVLDVPTHTYNPLLWPWQVGPLAPVPFADELWFDLATWTVWIAFFLVVLWAYWRR